jgi:hypothetical protein
VTPQVKGPLEFSVVVGTPDGGLKDRRTVTVPKEGVPPIPAQASISPEGGVVEIGELFKLTVTANQTLKEDGWHFGWEPRDRWEPRDLLYGLKTYEDSAKLVMTLSGRRSGIVSLRVDPDVNADSVAKCQANLYVLPPMASLKIPSAWTAALVLSIAGAIQANEQQKYTARRWWTFVAIPVTAIGTGRAWMNYRRIRNARREFLEQVPNGVVPEKARAIAQKR